RVPRHPGHVQRRSEARVSRDGERGGGRPVAERERARPRTDAADGPGGPPGGGGGAGGRRAHPPVETVARPPQFFSANPATARSPQASLRRERGEEDRPAPGDQRQDGGN